MKTLRILIEASHNETQQTPIRNAVDEFVTRLPNMGFQDPVSGINFDLDDSAEAEQGDTAPGIDPGDYTVAEFPEAFADLSPALIAEATTVEVRGKNRVTALEALSELYYDKTMLDADPS